MSNLAHVLIVGNEPQHMEAMASVLHHFWSVSTTDLEHSVISAQMADVVVLCHTLPDPERQRWLEHTRHELRDLIVIKMNGYDSGPHAGADATVDMDHGPAALVFRIYELVTERGLGSRSWHDAENFVTVAGVH